MQGKRIDSPRRTWMRATLALAAAAAVGAAQAQPKPAVVRLADQPGAEVDYAAVWVGEMLGYFDQEGIKIDRRTYPNGPAAIITIFSRCPKASGAFSWPTSAATARRRLC